MSTSTTGGAMRAKRQTAPALTNHSPMRSTLRFLRSARVRLREYIEFDSRLIRGALATLGTSLGLVLWLCKNHRTSLLVLTKVHRAAFSRWSSRVVERVIRQGLFWPPTHTHRSVLLRVYREHVER